MRINIEQHSNSDVTVTDPTKAAELLNQSYCDEGFNMSWTETGYIWKIK